MIASASSWLTPSMLAAATSAARLSGFRRATVDDCVTRRVEGTTGSLSPDPSARVMDKFDMGVSRGGGKTRSPAVNSTAGEGFGTRWRGRQTPTGAGASAR